MDKNLKVMLISAVVVAGAAVAVVPSYWPGLLHGGDAAQTEPAKPQITILALGEKRAIYPPRRGDEPSASCELEGAEGNHFTMHCKASGFYITPEGSEEKVYDSEDAPYEHGRVEVTEVQVSDPSYRLWSIVYDSNGNSGTQHGYWLVGEKDGQFISYITPTSMKEAGLPMPDAEDWGEKKGGHRLRFYVEDGVLKMEYTFEFWPPNVSHAEAWRVLDKTADIQWDNDSSAFQLTNIQDVGDMKVSRAKGFGKEIQWEKMTDDEKTYYENGLKEYRSQHLTYVKRVNQSYSALTGGKTLY